MITDIEIKDEFYKLIKGSTLASTVTGVLSKRRRPKNSEKEDIIISVLANLNGQKQEAVVNVNIYVKGEYVKENDQYEEPTVRARTLCRLSAELLEVGHFQGARFVLEEQRVMEVPDTDWYVINNRISLTKINE